MPDPIQRLRQILLTVLLVLLLPLTAPTAENVPLATSLRPVVDGPTGGGAPGGDSPPASTGTKGPSANGERAAPDARIINLETAVTASVDYWRGKGINYRMNPANAPALTAARIDAVSLANNHVLDWGYAGLVETLVLITEIE